MSTLSPFFLISRLAPLRRLPFWAQALAVCAVFAIVGVAVVDDYGLAGNEIQYRKITIAIADYIAIGDLSELSQYRDPAYRYYGVAFDMPLMLLRRALGLQDTRHIYLMRHLLTHLLFIAGGFACGMLVYRMLGSRWVALLAMLMFLLHPRLYAHSFFNIKDIPFAALLVIALYLAHRAFHRDTLGAFLLCGIGAGLAISVRPFGLMLLPMLLAMRALDLWQASGGGARRRVLITSAMFLVAALAVVYITHPYYWENPLRFVEGVSTLSQHPILIQSLFMGEIYRSDAVPWNYIPVWFAITAPPLALLLGAVGCAAVCWQVAARPLAALRDRETRFRILLLGCFALPVAIVIILQSNIYHGWRHMHFLWGPFCLLAAVGLHTIANSNVGKGILGKLGWLPRRVRGVGQRRALAYGIAGVGLITTLIAMAALHPHQQVYFNALADTKTPGALGERYDMDHNRIAHLQMLEYLLDRYLDDSPRVFAESQSRQILPQSDRERIIEARNLNSADYYIPYIGPRNVLKEPLLYSVEAYGSAIAIIVAPMNAAAYRAAYDEVEANGTLLAREAFDIYIHNGALHYLNSDCDPPATSAAFWVFLHIIPRDPVDLPADRREHGFENRDFLFKEHAAFLDGKCIYKQVLPDYPIAHIRTGQTATASGGNEWLVDIDLAARAIAQALYEGIAAGDYGHPVAQSDFDVYLRGNRLAYLKENCAAGDTDARFFLHIIPVDTADLPTNWRERGFANLDFQFGDHGAYAGDVCVATLELPNYPIERIRTGQFVSGESRVWGVEFPAAR